MYVNAVANSVWLHLYLQNDFYHIFFKLNHILYIVLGSAPQMKNSGCPHVVFETQSENEGRVGHQASNIEN